MEQRLHRLENELAYAKEEVVFLKTAGGKCEDAETKGIQASAEVKSSLIHEAGRQDGNLMNISTLSQTAGVSQSGYYAWLEAAPLRQSREETEDADLS